MFALLMIYLIRAGAGEVSARGWAPRASGRGGCQSAPQPGPTHLPTAALPGILCFLNMVLCCAFLAAGLDTFPHLSLHLKYVYPTLCFAQQDRNVVHTSA